MEESKIRKAFITPTMFWIGIGVSVVLTILLSIQNYSLSAQQAAIILRQSEINDRLNARDAWFQVGLKTAAQQREEAFYKRDTQLKKVLKTPTCVVSSELAVVDSVPDFQPIETVLLQGER